MTVDPVFGIPQGAEGIAALENMNDHHRPLSEWALSLLPAAEPARILDIGCGGGMLISLLSKKYPGSLLNGIDLSDESVRFSERTNDALIKEGRCVITKASVSDIPFSDGTFDLVISCESYFFWPDLAHGIGEACRVLKDGGCLAIVSEAYPDPDFEEINRAHADKYGMKLVGNREMESIMESYGLDVTTTVVKERNWVIFCARKTDPSC